MISVDAWKPAEGLTLEPNALLAAKEQAHSLALTAGPGAGKTEVLAQRADFLLRTGTCRYPKRILAISFKVDASTNLKERVNQRCGYAMASRFDSYTFHAFAKRIIDKFRPILKGEYALDPGYEISAEKIIRSRNIIEFSDLVPMAIEILKQSKIARNAVRMTYSDVFLDEFQDCTNLQYELLKLVFLDTEIRLTAVGDTKQRIMGWAGALDGIFQKFSTDFSAIPLRMYRNFRSKPRLLRLQNEIIRTIDPKSIMPEEQLAGDDGEIFIGYFDDSFTEADHLANLINHWIKVEQTSPAEIAILVAKLPSFYAYHLMKALEVRHIPFRDEQEMQDITVEPAARLIVDYLSCLYGQREPKAWTRLTNQLSPFGDEKTQASARNDLNQFIKQQREEVINTASIQNKFSNWTSFAEAFLRQISLKTLVAMSADYESPYRLAEVIENTKKRINELNQLEPDLPKALSRFSDDQAVRILSIHKSKGLEFDSVIVMAVENETFFDKQDAERCAYFVGVSRAKDRLVLTHVDQRVRPVGYKRRWDVERSPQTEYLGYAEPFVR